MVLCDRRDVRTHDLLEIDAKEFLSTQNSAPEWVEESLVEAAFVVVRSGRVTSQGIPVGVRGRNRNHRWASFCSARIVKDVITPAQLLLCNIPSERKEFIPAYHSLEVLKDRWKDLDHAWGPGGSLGFELATGRHVATPESDLDIVLYAERRITAFEARLLCAQTANLPSAVDVRGETFVCGFSLAEFASGSSRILLRTRDELILGNDPWSHELETEDMKPAWMES
jgi:phosphoribosyl-dephospho-CoA transferase